MCKLVDKLNSDHMITPTNGFILMLCWLGLMACQGQPQQATESTSDTLTSIPTTFPPNNILSQSATGDSTPFADVFQPWDGHWQGTFLVYTDTLGQRKGTPQPRLTSAAYLDSLPLKLQSTIQVEQFYASTSPYYQTVRILDTYPDANGNLQTAESTGYNQVKGDQLLCVVNKPDEQVIHLGTTLGKGTIIWERKLLSPTKIEYFFETATDSSYQITGWGYYGGDDPALGPKTWFAATYKRVDEGEE